MTSANLAHFILVVYNGNVYDAAIKPILENYFKPGDGIFGTPWFSIFPGQVKIRETPLDLERLATFVCGNPKADVLHYDLESNYAAITDVIGAMSTAMSTIKAAGYISAMGPDKPYWDSYYQQFDYSNIDIAIIQQQRLTAAKADWPTYVSTIQTIRNWIKSKNPDSVVYAQLSLRQLLPLDFENLVIQIKSSVDGIVLAYLPKQTVNATPSNLDLMLSYLRLSH